MQLNCIFSSSWPCIRNETSSWECNWPEPGANVANIKWPALKFLTSPPHISDLLWHSLYRTDCTTLHNCVSYTFITNVHFSWISKYFFYLAALVLRVELFYKNIVGIFFIVELPVPSVLPNFRANFFWPMPEGFFYFWLAKLTACSMSTKVKIFRHFNFRL